MTVNHISSLFSQVKVREVLYEGYNDPLVDFIHSNFTANLISLVEVLFGIPIDMPELPTLMGYFPNVSFLFSSLFVFEPLIKMATPLSIRSNKPLESCKNYNVSV